MGDQRLLLERLEPVFGSQSHRGRPNRLPELALEGPDDNLHNEPGTWNVAVPAQTARMNPRPVESYCIAPRPSAFLLDRSDSAEMTILKHASDNCRNSGSALVI